jgi:hypothetical protein
MRLIDRDSGFHVPPNFIKSSYVPIGDVLREHPVLNNSNAE